MHPPTHRQGLLLLASVHHLDVLPELTLEEQDETVTGSATICPTANALPERLLLAVGRVLQNRPEAGPEEQEGALRRAQEIKHFEHR